MKNQIFAFVLLSVFAFSARSGAQLQRLTPSAIPPVSISQKTQTTLGMLQWFLDRETRYFADERVLQVIHNPDVIKDELLEVAGRLAAFNDSMNLSTYCILMGISIDNSRINISLRGSTADALNELRLKFLKNTLRTAYELVPVDLAYWQDQKSNSGVDQVRLEALDSLINKQLEAFANVEGHPALVLKYIAYHYMLSIIFRKIDDTVATQKHLGKVLDVIMTECDEIFYSLRDPIGNATSLAEIGDNELLIALNRLVKLKADITDALKAARQNTAPLINASP